MRISLSGYLFSIGFDLRPYLDVALFGVSCRVPHRIQLKPYVDVACFVFIGLYYIGFSQCLDLDVKFKQDKLCEIHRMWRKTGIDVEIQLN